MPTADTIGDGEQKHSRSVLLVLANEIVASMTGSHSLHTTFKETLLITLNPYILQHEYDESQQSSFLH